MEKMITIAVDAMGGDNSPQKIIDGIELYNRNSKNIFYKIFGDKNIIDPIIQKKL
jgi:glycerol-3-phosphate acyltransferase PlsX